MATSTRNGYSTSGMNRGTRQAVRPAIPGRRFLPPFAHPCHPQQGPHNQPHEHSHHDIPRSRPAHQQPAHNPTHSQHRPETPHQDGRRLDIPVAVTAGYKIEVLRQWASSRSLSADRARRMTGSVASPMTGENTKARRPVSRRPSGIFVPRSRLFVADGSTVALKVDRPS